MTVSNIGRFFHPFLVYGSSNSSPHPCKQQWGERCSVAGPWRRRRSFFFQISQHKSKSRRCRTRFATFGGGTVCQSLSTLAMLPGVQPIAAQKFWAKGHSEKMWSAISSACLHTSHVGSLMTYDVRLILSAESSSHLTVFFLNNKWIEPLWSFERVILCYLYHHR